MTSTPTTTTSGSSGHPIAVFAERAHARLDALAETPAWSLSDDDLRALLPELTRLSARLAELELRVAAQADANHVGDATGAATTAAWWAHATRMTHADARRKVRLAAALDNDRPNVRGALAAGDVLVDQAAVITSAVDQLPDDVAPDTVAEAERFLLSEAKALDAKRLRVLSRRLLEVVDPDAADAHEAALLEKEEAAARTAASLRMVDDGHGRVHGRFTLPTLQGAMLKKALLAIAAPRHRAAVDGIAATAEVATPLRLGQAFLEYVERYPADRLPKAGGVAATVVVTMSQDSLLGGLRAAGLDTGERISAGEARRLACSAGIIPAVLGGPSQVLDLGRKRRFHTESQRIVLAIEQGGCVVEGCDWPPGMCHAHHPKPWSEGGGTDRDGWLLCPRHHTLAHDPRYDHRRLSTGAVRFHRRT